MNGEIGLSERNRSRTLRNPGRQTPEDQGWCWGGRRMRGHCPETLHCRPVLATVWCLLLAVHLQISIFR